MKRIALILATLGILALAATSVQADWYHHGHHGGYYGGHYGGWRPGPVVVARPQVWVAPPVVRPYPAYGYGYGYGYYYPTPAYGFYYQGRGLSIGVGF